MAQIPRIYLDTSAVVAGIWSAEVGARMILKLGEAEAIKIVINSQVLHELDQVLRKKAPELIVYTSILLDRSGVEVLPNPDHEIIRTCDSFTHHSGDALVIAGAWKSNTDYFVTLDQKHFLNNPSLISAAPFLIGTPGDFLAWYRGRLP